MMTDRDQKFYFKLFLYMLALLIGVRCYLWFAGFDQTIPYVDPFLLTLWKVVRSVMVGFSRSISPG